MSENYPTEWELLPLEEVVGAIIDYRGKTPKKESSGIPLVTAKIVKAGKLLEASEYISEDNYDSWMKRGFPEIGDVVITTEAPLGEVAQLKSNKVALAQRIVTLRGKKGITTSDYLYCVFQGDFVQHQLEARASGSTVKGIKQSELRKVEVPIPPLHEQEFISNQIQLLNAKIDLNEKQNNVLEQISQAIFKSWFIDFEPTKVKIAAREALLAENPAATPEQIATAEQQAAIQAIAGAGDVIPTEQLQIVADLFPNHLVDSELGEIPYGWEVNRLIELINITGGGTPKRSESSFWGGDISWFSVRDVPNSSDIFVTRTEEKITELGLKKSSTKLIPKGSTIITARGTVGKLALVAEDMCMNQSCYAIRSDRFGDFYNYFNLRQSVETLQRNTHGAVFDTITTRTFETYSLAYGGDEISSVFDTVVEPIMKRIELNVRQNSLLSEVRDTLLPKLLSGQMQAI